MKRPVIIGHSGVVGDALVRRSTARGTDVVTASRSGGSHRIDLGDPKAAWSALDRIEPTLIILAAAMTNVDLCERDPQQSEIVNIHGPSMVARWCARNSTPLVFFSSDYVFDGKAGPYREDADPNPINVYGRHKLRAEKAVQDLLPERSLILRTTVVFGRDPGHKNFVARLIGRLRSGERIQVPDDQIGTPTWSDDLACACLELISCGATGVVHVAGASHVSRTHFARRCAEAFDLDPDLIDGVATENLKQEAPRPLIAGLTSSRLGGLIGRPMGTIEEALAQYSAQTVEDADEGW